MCLDAEGRSQFYELLRRCGQRTQAVFYAFDLLALHGDDLRARALIERKRLLRSLIPEQPSVLLYASHIGGQGREFYQLACERDLGGHRSQAEAWRLW